MMKQLTITQFGNKILRTKTRPLSEEEIHSNATKQLIEGMRQLLLDKKLGVGLAAPQVGHSVAVAIIAIRPSETRPEAENFDLVIINPEIVELSPQKELLWEGCISSGNGKAGLFARVPRSMSVKVKYWDESGGSQTSSFTGLRAQVLQHEIDHLNATLFVDRVEDSTTYMTRKEYLKMRRAEQHVAKKR